MPQHKETRGRPLRAVLETPKTLLYVYRVLLTGIHLMRTGRIEANLVTLNQEFSTAAYYRSHCAEDRVGRTVESARS